MQYTELGARGPKVSTIGFGAWAIGGQNWGPTDDEASRRALHHAIDEGVTLIDTADVYGFGHSEALIAEVLRTRGKGDVVIATKAGNDFYYATADNETGYGRIKPNFDRAYLIEAAEKSLKRLGLETLDILQLHSPETALLATDDPWDALTTLKKQGKIRHAGLSVQSFAETAQAPYLDPHKDLIDVLQVRYNLLEREAEEALLPKAQALGMGVIVRIPILFGLLTGKFHRESRFNDDDHRRFNLSPEKLDAYLGRLEQLQPLYERYRGQTMTQVSLRFCVTHPGCHAAIPGAKTPEQVAENCAASDLGPLEGGLPPAV
jgi:aryl-alcohol dehydrogenase-like predicted oxidoreductase